MNTLWIDTLWKNTLSEKTLSENTLSKNTLSENTLFTFHFSFRATRDWKYESVTYLKTDGHCIGMCKRHLRV